MSFPSRGITALHNVVCQFKAHVLSFQRDNGVTQGCVSVQSVCPFLPEGYRRYTRLCVSSKLMSFPSRGIPALHKVVCQSKAYVLSFQGDTDITQSCVPVQSLCPFLPGGYRRYTRLCASSKLMSFPSRGIQALHKVMCQFKAYVLSF